MRAAAGIGIAGLVLTLATLGCAADRPRVYERQIQVQELATDVGSVDNAYSLLVDRKTQGRFACSLAIAKLVATDDARRLNLVALTPAEEARWLVAFRGLSELRDLQFLSPIDVRPEEPRTDTLCAAAAALEARLLLLYVPNRYAANSSQVLGVLYELETHYPVASLHASASFLDEDGQEVAPEPEPGDQREIDAYYQASRAFETRVLQCLGELIRNDLPPATTQPHRWDTPPEERWWLPLGRRGD